MESLQNMQYGDGNDCWVHPEWCRTFENPLQILSPANGGTSYERTREYIQEIHKIENEVLSSQELSEEVKKKILITYSVARYSAAYWHNALYGGREPEQGRDNTTGFLVALSTLGVSNAIQLSEQTDVAGIATGIFMIVLLDK